MSVSSPLWLLLILLACFSPAIIVGIISKLREARFLSFDVRLDSKRKWLSFDAESFLYRMTEEQLDQALELFDPASKKNRLRIRWSYSSPAGRNRYQKALVRRADEALKADLLEAKSGQQNGEVRVRTLNSAYAKALELGKEIEDGIPKIYCYQIPGSERHRGQVKVGFASGNAHRRVEQQFKTAARIETNYEIIFVMPALTVSGVSFKDHAVHRVLREAKIQNTEGEWFRCSAEKAKAAVSAVQQNRSL